MSFKLRCLLFSTVVATAAAAINWSAEPSTASRAYKNGPLTIADFRGMPPSTGEKSRFTAHTATALRWEATYQSITRSGRTTTTISSLKCEARIEQDQSWNTQIGNPDLLDHEQGHFDLAHAAALRLQVRYEQLRRQRKLPVGRHANAKESIKLVEREIQRWSDEESARLREADQDYDLHTNHGLKKQEQAEHRHLHSASIAELEKKLQEVFAKKK